MTATPAVLIPSRHRRVVWGLVALSWLVALGLGVHYAGTTHASHLDAGLVSWIRATVGDRNARLLIWASSPPVVYAGIAATAVAGLRTRGREFAALAVASPVLVVALVEFVGKPLVDRHLAGYLCYPSGHTVSAVSALTVALLGVSAGAQPMRRLSALAGWVVGTCAVALGLVAMNYHYPTDTIGGVGVVLGTVLPLAALTDAAAARRTSTRRS